MEFIKATPPAAAIPPKRRVHQRPVRRLHYQQVTEFFGGSVDDFNGNNFDQTGLGFIRGARIGSSVDETAVQRYDVVCFLSLSKFVRL